MELYEIVRREKRIAARKGKAEGKAEGRIEGKAEGKASALLTVLSSKGKVSEELEQKIQAQTKQELLDKWLGIAAVAPDVDAFEQQIMQS